MGSPSTLVPPGAPASVPAPAVAAPLPVPPAPPIPQAPATPLPRQHAFQQILAAKLTEGFNAANAAQAPSPLTPASDQNPVTAIPDTASPTPEAAPTAPSPAESAPAVPDFDLDSIDFDSPDDATAPPTDGAAPPSPETAPSPDDRQAQADLDAAVAEGIPEKIEAAFLRTPRGRFMLESFKTLRELRNPVEEGGIGRVPTLDEIRAGDAANQHLSGMRFDFSSDPESFVRNVLVPTPRENGSLETFLGNADHARATLSAIPRVLMENPQANAALIDAYGVPLFQMFFQGQYERALAMPQETPAQIQDYRSKNQDPPLLAEKAAQLDALRRAEFAALRTTTPLPGIDFPGVNGNGLNPNATDPRIRDLQAQNQRLTQQLTTQQQLQAQSAMQSIESANRDAALHDIDRTFAAAKLDKVYPRELLDPLKRDLYELVQSHVTGQSGLPYDPGGLQTYQIRLAEVARGQQPNGMDPRKVYAQLFRNALRNSPEVQARFKKLVQEAKNYANSRAANIPSQTRTEPVGTGVAAPGSVLPVPQNVRQPGETQVQYASRVLRESYAAAAPQGS